PITTRPMLARKTDPHGSNTWSCWKGLAVERHRHYSVVPGGSEPSPVYSEPAYSGRTISRTAYSEGAYTASPYTAGPHTASAYTRAYTAGPHTVSEPERARDRVLSHQQQTTIFRSDMGTSRAMPSSRNRRRPGFGDF